MQTGELHGFQNFPELLNYLEALGISNRKDQTEVDLCLMDDSDRQILVIYQPRQANLQEFPLTPGGQPGES